MVQPESVFIINKLRSEGFTVDEVMTQYIRQMLNDVYERGFYDGGINEDGCPKD